MMIIVVSLALDHLQLRNLRDLARREEEVPDAERGRRRAVVVVLLYTQDHRCMSTQPNNKCPSESKRRAHRRAASRLAVSDQPVGLQRRRREERPAFAHHREEVRTGGQQVLVQPCARSSPAVSRLAVLDMSDR